MAAHLEKRRKQLSETRCWGWHHLSRPPGMQHSALFTPPLPSSASPGVLSPSPCRGQCGEQGGQREREHRGGKRALGNVDRLCESFKRDRQVTLEVACLLTYRATMTPGQAFLQPQPRAFHSLLHHKGPQYMSASVF